MQAYCYFFSFKNILTKGNNLQALGVLCLIGLVSLVLRSLATPRLTLLDRCLFLIQSFRDSHSCISTLKGLSVFLLTFFLLFFLVFTQVCFQQSLSLMNNSHSPSHSFTSFLIYFIFFFRQSPFSILSVYFPHSFTVCFSLSPHTLSSRGEVEHAPSLQQA